MKRYEAIGKSYKNDEYRHFLKAINQKYFRAIYKSSKIYIKFKLSLRDFIMADDICHNNVVNLISCIKETTILVC